MLISVLMWDGVDACMYADRSMYATEDLPRHPAFYGKPHSLPPENQFGTVRDGSMYATAQCTLAPPKQLLNMRLLSHTQ